MSQVVGLPNNSYKPINNTAWVRVRLCKLQKGCTRLAAASDKVCQLLAHGRWFSQETPASSTSKTGRHDITEILLKVALNAINHMSTVLGLMSTYFVVLCRFLFVPLFLFFWSLNCLSFFELRFLITHVVSSSMSYHFCCNCQLGFLK